LVLPGGRQVGGELAGGAEYRDRDPPAVPPALMISGTWWSWKVKAAKKLNDRITLAWEYEHLYADDLPAGAVWRESGQKWHLLWQF